MIDRAISSLPPSGDLGENRLQREGVKLSPENVLQRSVDHAVLLDERLAGEHPGDDRHLVVIAPARQVPNSDGAARKSRLDTPANLTRVDHLCLLDFRGQFIMPPGSAENGCSTGPRRPCPG